MTLGEAVPAIVSALGGGAAGAIINQLITSYRNRLQPIGFRYESSMLFAPPAGDVAPRFGVTFISHAGAVTSLTNVHALRIEIINRGNQDRASMTLGVTIPAGQGIVHAEQATSDRHHNLKVEGDIQPANPTNEIDVVLQPFNRGDLYVLTLYVTLPTNADEAGPIEFSSSEAVRFVELPSAAETAIGIVEGASVLLGPLRLSMGIR